MKYRLVHLSGSLAGRVREVDAARLVLGRDPASAEVVFGAEDRSVSRRHASIEEDNGVLMLRLPKSAEHQPRQISVKAS